MYKSIRNLFDNRLIKCGWLESVNKILNDCGLTYIWNDCTNVNYEWFCNIVKQKLIDQFTQKWYDDISNSQKGYNYRIFKENHGKEDYLSMNLPYCLQNMLMRFRTGNHKLPVERGRYQSIERMNRNCDLCDTHSVGDEYHFIMECKSLSTLRSKYFPQYYCKHNSAIKFRQLMGSKDKKLLIKLAKFIKDASRFLEK